MTTTYTHEDIKVLDSISHIRHAKGMYIGETPNPNHLLYEVLDNALDECISGNATMIGIEIDSKKHVISVADNGRGIPFQNNTIKTIATVINSGGKFNKGKNGTYSISAGLHGIGLVAVTALCDWVEYQVYRDGKHVTARIEDAKYVSEVIVDFTDKKPFSTQVTFKPTKKYFDSLTLDVSKIRDRLKVASIHVKDLNIILIIDGVREIINCRLDSYFQDEILGQKHNIEQYTKIIDLSHKKDDEKVSIKFCWDLLNKGAKTKAGVNLLNVDLGTHINSFYDVIKTVIFEEAEKEKFKIEKLDSLVGLRCYISMMLYKPEFSSQTKEKLSVSKQSLEFLFSEIEKQFRELLKQDDSFRMMLLNHFATYRKKLNNTNTIVKTNAAGVTRYCSDIDSNLRDCTSHDIKNSELFICEGESAAGAVISVRDVKHHAILALKGKIKNIADENQDFYKSKVIIDIINALGTGAENDFDASCIRYSKVIISTDSDADGAHIACLILTALLRLTPQLFDMNIVYKSELPLYGAVANKVFYPFYNATEMETFKKDHPNIKIQRFKGLGEMNPDQLKVCMLDSHTRRLTPISKSTNSKNIFDLMTSAELKRNLVKHG